MVIDISKCFKCKSQEKLKFTATQQAYISIYNFIKEKYGMTEIGNKILNDIYELDYFELY